MTNYKKHTACLASVAAMSTKSACSSSSSSSSLSAGRWLPDVRLVSPKLFANHVKVCTETNCAECIWAKKGAKWRKRFPWLRGGYKPSGDFGLGCTFCAQSAVKNKAGRQELADFPSGFDSFTMVSRWKHEELCFPTAWPVTQPCFSPEWHPKGCRKCALRSRSRWIWKTHQWHESWAECRRTVWWHIVQEGDLDAFSLAEGILDVYREFCQRPPASHFWGMLLGSEFGTFLALRHFDLWYVFVTLIFWNCELNNKV